MLGYASSALNEYFTMAELGMKVELPVTGVPNAVFDALGTCEGTYSLDWWRVSAAVMALDDDTWRRWRRFLRRHKGERPFTLWV